MMPGKKTDGKTSALNINITKKQEQFVKATADEVLYGGAAGGGKSHGQLVDALLYALKYPCSKQLILRRTYPELEKSLIRAHLIMYPRGIYRYNKSSHSGRFANGSIIDFGYIATEGDVTQYQSAEYDVIRFDELTHFTSDMYTYMLSRLRGANSYPKQIKSATNPGGIGHTWVKARFIDPAPPNTVHTVTDGDGGTMQRVFIPASIYDNPFIMQKDPGYIRRLKLLPKDKQRALLYGDWDLTEGSYFPEFSATVHTIKPFKIPKNWEIYRALDYGLDMLACYWIAVDFYGRAYVIRELYEPGLIISDAARRILAATPPEEDIYATIAPPDMWNRRQDTGKSVTDIFAEHGIYLQKAQNDRVQGWYNLKEWLRPFADEQGKTIAGLRIFDTCRNLIRCLPALQVDDHNPNDVAKQPHELTHGPDAIRYFVAGRPTPAVLPREVDEDEPINDLQSFLTFGN